MKWICGKCFAEKEAEGALKTCPTCHSDEVVPVGSPRGALILARAHAQATAAPRPPLLESLAAGGLVGLATGMRKKPGNAFTRHLGAREVVPLLLIGVGGVTFAVGRQYGWFGGGPSAPVVHSLGAWKNAADPAAPYTRTTSADATQRQIQAEVAGARVWTIGDHDEKLVVSVPGCREDVLTKGFNLEMLRGIGFVSIQCAP